MKIKATHQGTCQVCGRTQKLPGGVVAKHGYTVQGWYGSTGSFMGTCKGSGKKPLEVACDWLDQHIALIREDIAAEQIKISMVYAGAAVGTSGMSGSYRFGQVVFEQGEYRYYVGDTLVPLELKEGQSVADRCIEKSRWTLDKAQGFIRKCEAVITELQERIATWQPQPLQPLK